jgi:hypothetical protein
LSNFSNAELDIFASHAKNLEKLYKADIVSKEQYEREWERLGEKGYLYDYAFGNIKVSGDELYLVGGIALYRSVQMVGSAFISSQLFQKVVSEDPKVAEIVSKTSKMSPTSSITERWKWDQIHTSVGEVRKWFFETKLAEEYKKAFQASSEAETLLDAVDATLKHLLKNNIHY